jgi:uncharacterized protein (DUF2235 family)
MPTKKRIVLCTDGTWNRPDELDRGVPAPTNVSKLACAIAREDASGVPQIVYYHSGVGSEGNILDHVVGGAFGVGVDRIIEDNYRFVAQNYADGDELWLFGFSRGAYIARSTAGLIRNAGLLRPDALDHIPEAVALYRRADAASAPDGPDARAFRQRFARDIGIHCIGVWDTVGALGIPRHVLPLFESALSPDMGGRVSRYEFHDNKLSSTVKNAFHALAIDEHRKPFEPSVWIGQSDALGQRLEQAWFAGAHSNVGGGYADHGLSDIALGWMIERAASCGLAVGTPPGMQPSVKGAIVNSFTPLYEIFGRLERSIQLGVGGQFVHPSVEDRLRDATLDYHPQNLPRS